MQVLVLLLALAQACSGMFFIPATTIDNTAAFFSDASRGWATMRDEINGQISRRWVEHNYGVYVLLTSLYGAAAPTAYDDAYMHSVVGGLQRVGATTWDDAQLDSISATFQAAHPTQLVISAAAAMPQSCQGWALVAAAMAALC
ncbi:hypothetical protein GGI04_005088 [Coemansia thaxteri]|uniref:Uncharacterized protein n=1 Tax=Coemansia thaxteri TaxID=2663907 RepID=A0A9W8EHN5_9FUNG|nr:hypothetical protein GGI04_005088 [Coemansia thaxteri]KAJ2007645.1 hypothetical protein H4R26_000665 [Coemansia thaxteri]KAJ2461752.1 hypothetical protein GGI02_005624 [Coemansia sp. RSA 2322]KAJ2487652.1 hypothetical protein EV174_000409 [Coemansia sp. RSA 2320]